MGPKAPFSFGFDRSSAMHMSLLLMKIADQLGSSIEGCDLVISEHLFSLLPLICHPQAYGHLTRQPCGSN